MAEYLIQDTTLTDIADAIREKTGETGTMNPIEFPEKISAIEIAGKSVESTVDLNEVGFADGNIEVFPEDETTFKKITVIKPDNLTPGNIAEGVDIAGIVGTLVAGSGGGGLDNLVFASGSITASGSTATISHNLGVVPDIACVLSIDSISTTLGILGMYNFSKALLAVGMKGYAATKNLQCSASGEDYCLDGTDTQGMGFISKATETTMSVGGTMVLQSSARYQWFAIGGLT